MLIVLNLVENRKDKCLLTNLWLVLSRDRKMLEPTAVESFNICNLEKKNINIYLYSTKLITGTNIIIHILIDMESYLS